MYGNAETIKRINAKIAGVSMSLPSMSVQDTDSVIDESKQKKLDDLCEKLKSGELNAKQKKSVRKKLQKLKKKQGKGKEDEQS